TLLYYDPIYLEHDTGGHPEGAYRLRSISKHLAETGLDARCERPEVKAVSTERLARVHRLEYINEIRDFAAHHGGYIDADTVVSTKSYEAACKAAGAACGAVERVVGGDDPHALCLVRPPGHHALRSNAMGFCLFNNAAIAARVAVAELDLDRVLIVDWDVHHGNGTQDTFWEDEQVAYLSIHRSPFFPGTGSADEKGSGPGLGTIVNVPIEFGTPTPKYLDALQSELHALADRIRPQLVIISAGFDAHRLDPLGSLGLRERDFAVLTRDVMDVAATHAESRIVSVLEGGYNVDFLPLCVEAHLRTLNGEAESG
ncbi:MAG: histone deacetylase, partial [Pirellulaceae bacterium]